MMRLTCRIVAMAYILCVIGCTGGGIGATDLPHEDGILDAGEWPDPEIAHDLSVDDKITTDDVKEHDATLPDVPMETDGDAITGEDLSFTPDIPVSCKSGWQPLGVLGPWDYTESVTDLAVIPDGRYLVLSRQHVIELFSLAPFDPVRLDFKDAAVIDPAATWSRVEPAPGGVVALSSQGKTVKDLVVRLHYIKVAAGGLETGPALKIPFPAYEMDVSGDRVAVASASLMAVYRFRSGAWSLVVRRDLPKKMGYINGLLLVGDTLVVTAYSGLYLVPLDPADPVKTLKPAADPQIPLKVPAGILVPETGNFWTGSHGALEMLDVADGTLTWLANPPVISAFDAEDGPFQATLYQGHLFLANSESGVLRATWTLDGLTIPSKTTLTPYIWPGFTARPQRIERIDDVLVLVGAGGGSVGIVRVCE